MTSLLPSYTHIINPKLKHTYLSFDEEGRLIIKSPQLSQRSIESLLIKKSAWIRRTQKKLAEKKGQTVKLLQEHILYYLGHCYPIYLREESAKRAQLTYEEGVQFTLYHHTFDANLLIKQIDRFYRKQAERIIPPLVERWAKKMKVTPEVIRFRKTRRQWGSCSSKNILSFNTMLMKLPIEAIEYVVVHELAHITHKHHQKAFWDLVAYHLPDYRERQHILHEYTPL